MRRDICFFNLFALGLVSLTPMVGKQTKIVSDRKLDHVVKRSGIETDKLTNIGGHRAKYLLILSSQLVYLLVILPPCVTVLCLNILSAITVMDHLSQNSGGQIEKYIMKRYFRLFQKRERTIEG